MSEDKITVRLYCSAIGTKPKQRLTLKAMGLNKIGDTAELPDNPAVRGMIEVVKHLLAPAPPRRHKKPHFGARPSHRRPE
jgi:large subunit ribosomal protein L30